MRATQSADLSREISGLVVRILGGEPIDRGDAGSALAARYPELGMSAELIAKAIDRSVAMLGDIRNGAANGAARHVEVAPEPIAADSRAEPEGEAGIVAEAVAPMAPADAAEAAGLPPAPEPDPKRRGPRAFEQSLASLRRFAGRLSRNSSVERSETV